MPNSFMGIPIDGYTRSGRTYREQRSAEEFAALLQSLISDPLIAAVHWTQYTPYFNDGDVCEFGANSVSVRTVHDAPDEYWGDYEVSDYHPTLGSLAWVKDAEPTKTKWGGTWYGHHDEPRDNPHYDAERLRLAQAFSDAVESGNYDQVLNDLFGDHAEVTVTRDGITIEEYDHE